MSEPPSRGGRAGAVAPHIPGEAGVWVFIFGDLSVFAILFGTLVYYRDKTPHAFTLGQRYLHSIYGVTNTLLLLTSSLAVVLGVRCLRAAIEPEASPANARRARICLGLAMFCGAWFLVNKGLEWGTLIADHHDPAGNGFFTYFFVLTGLHALHLIVGMCVLGTIIVLSRRPTLNRRQLVFFEGGACFWHMVDLIWIVLFALLYLAH